MKDDLEIIKQVLHKTPPLKTNESAKQHAINLALAKFDEKNLKVSQGMLLMKRLNNTACAVRQFIFGSKPMKNYQYALIGSVCTVFIILAVVPLPSFYTQSLFDNDSPVLEVVAESTPQNDASPLKEHQVTDTKLLVEKAASDAQASANEEIKIELQTANSQMKAMTVRKVPQQHQTEIVANSSELTLPDSSPKMAMKSESTDGLFDPSPTRMLKAAPSMYRIGLKGMASEAVNSHSNVLPSQDKFKAVASNALKITKNEPVSTFSIDVDTAAYSYVRSILNANQLPAKDSVRVEELINYFPYSYPAPTDKSEPFKTSVAVFSTPWNKDTKLLHIGIKGYQLDTTHKPTANLVFLVDTSGSMNQANKLPLLKNALKMLLDTLSAEDTVAIVTYAGSAGVALAPTKVKDKVKILHLIDELGAEGSTAGAEGIRQAYQLAEQSYNPNGINRVILATDGDFNVGITDTSELKTFVERKRASGVTLSVLGFGQGNYNDELMQTLAQNGNGNAAYIDNINEARKVLVEEVNGTLFTIAKDVKIQVEFNPAQVAEYRLVGYESRLLNTEDFKNDKVDAGDIGAGHSVTAVYEITPANSVAKLVDELRYKEKAPKALDKTSNEYGYVKVRYKLPTEDNSRLMTTQVTPENEYKSLSETPVDSVFVSSVAAFGQLLRGDSYLKDFNYDKVIDLAEKSKGEDKFGYRTEFVNLVRSAKNAPALAPLQ